MQYRVFLLVDNHIRAAESFLASDDPEATEIAAALYEACSDTFDKCEVWRGVKCVETIDLTNTRRRGITLAEVSRSRQENVLVLEETLHDTFACIRSSRKLLDATSDLRKRLRAH